MTVTTSTNKKTYTGDGSTTAFAYNYKILATTDLQVYTRLIASPYTETLQTETTHYSVSGAGDAGGGTVTMVSAPASTLQLIILRVVPQTQLTDYTANDAFPAETHEEALDRLAMIVQDQQETLDRTLKSSKTLSDLTTPEFVDPAAARASKFLGFSSDGTELQVSDGPLADTEISAAADAHVLIYDNSDSRWENKAVSGDIAITAAGVVSIASGVIVNADVSGSAAIADSKLATISTADKVSGAAVQVDGAADGTAITIANTDKFLIDDGGTTKYVNASQVNTYVSASVAADDIATGDAAASFETSSGAVVVDSQASTTTIDGHTGVTVQSSNSGDITLDSVADINLDAAGNDITLKAGGTHFGSLTNSSSDLVIEAKVADKDILFKGLDDSSAVTALSLDMSDAGKATFSGNVTVTGDLTITGDDLFLATNTSGAALIGDGTNYNPVVISGDIAIGTDGTAAIGSGVIVNADVSGSAAIADSKLDTISTANKVGLDALDIDGGTELGEAIVDADLMIIDNGAGGTNRKVLASRLKTFIGASTVTLANDADNRVVTATGSGGVNGESGLTYDGSDLSVDGDITVIGTTPTITIGDGGEEDAKIVFNGHQQDYHFGLDDTDDDLKIGLGSALGTTTHMSFDETGAVLTPLQPGFFAYPNAELSNVSGDGTAYVVVLNSERFDNNADHVNGIFTAPVGGVYHFDVLIGFAAIADGNTVVSVSLVTSNHTEILFYRAGDSHTGGYILTSGSSTVFMDAADTAKISITVSGGSKIVDIAATGNTHFSGFLVG